MVTSTALLVCLFSALTGVCGFGKWYRDGKMMLPTTKFQGFGPSLSSLSLSQHHDVVSISAAARSLVILVPFIEKQSNNVISSLKEWNSVGDPCPYLRSQRTKRVDLVFWFNDHFEAQKYSRFRESFMASINEALYVNLKCFGAVKFLSANLTISEDKYPLGPSFQWYNAFLADTPGLSGVYDYMFWHEHDVYPIRGGFIDKLFEDITFHGDFYVKGSIHRGNVINPVAKGVEHHIFHINGNSLYNFHDVDFFTLISNLFTDAESKLAASKSNFLSRALEFSMDVSLWSYAVANYGKDWKKYQQYAHKFVYSDFIQAFSMRVDQNALDTIYKESPNTYLIHGNDMSTGQSFTGKKTKSHKKKIRNGGKNARSAVQSKHTAFYGPRSESLMALHQQRVLVRAPSRSLVMMISFSKKQSKHAIASLKRWSAVGDPCPILRNSHSNRVDAVFWFNRNFDAPVNAKFSDSFRKAAYDALGNNVKCFRNITFMSAHSTIINDRYPFHSAFISDTHLTGLYDYMFWYEHEVYPIKGGFIDKLFEEITFHGNFFVKGSIHRGNVVNAAKGGSVYRRIISNALYNFHDADFLNLMKHVISKQRDTSSDSLFNFRTDYKANWPFIQRFAHKFIYGDFIQAHGAYLDNATSHDLQVSCPNTYLIQGNYYF